MSVLLSGKPGAVQSGSGAVSLAKREGRAAKGSPQLRGGPVSTWTKLERGYAMAGGTWEAVITAACLGKQQEARNGWLEGRVAQFEMAE